MGAPLTSSASTNMPAMRTFQVIGRGTSDEDAKLYKMKLFAPNEVVAKSRFWYLLSQIQKVKKATGEVVSMQEIFEKKPNTVKNFGIFLRYNSRSGTHNMYKEIRDVSLNGAIDKLYLDMAGRHRARKRSVYVIKAAPVAAKDCKRDTSKMFHSDKVRFPITHRAAKVTSRRYKKTFAATRPATHSG